MNLLFLRGQAYDGAGNMSGSVNGTAAIITREYPQAVYLHCASHCLNLAVVKSLQLTNIRNMMNVIGKVYFFFAAHPKRQRKLEDAITETQPSSTVHKLKDLCRTRWVQRLDAFSVFSSLYESTVSCLENICQDGPKLWSADSITDAHSLQQAISTTDFIASFVITNSSLQYLHSLTVNLQGKTTDIIHEIDTVISTIQNIRDNIETYHSDWYHQIEKMCDVTGTIPSIRRTCQRQIHRSNVPADLPSQYYLRTLSIPLVDHLLTEMKTRFSSHQTTALLGLCIVPSAMMTMPVVDFLTNTSKLADMYYTDLPSPDSFNSERDCWRVKWQKHLSEYGQASLPLNPSSTLQQTSSMYPNIRVLLLILSTLPVTTCSAERSFSGLKRTKTPFRSSMTTERLTSMSSLHIHKDIEINIPAAIDELSRKHPRRLQMSNIFSD